ncbi:hypothetical protein ZIOFF_029652 [Zingiber officinale]|uniref:SHSP domain-containing protein n=1 Tax=Zingiber officinale TaxID=94328 RepID=A0A8J5H1W1_ZINOF|nr:hypothetical protein ZIOFF_029652 [Zingiber officinale]
MPRSTSVIHRQAEIVFHNKLKLHFLFYFLLRHVDRRVLQISGQRTKEQEEKKDKWHRVERSSGKFLRRFRLPENAKVDQVKASMENGVLTVTIPKEEVKKPEVKSIEISG